MRILHVVETLENKADGVASFVQELVVRQRQAGQHVEYLTGDGLPHGELDGMVRERGPLALRAWTAVPRFDVVHLHALWVAATVVCGHVALLKRVPYIVTPHGMLDAWALSRSRRLKQLARRVALDRILTRAACIQALCEPERTSIADLAFRSPTALVPVGIDPDRLGTSAGGPSRTILFMGRIHPKKGVDLLVEAFQELAPRNPEWAMVIAGPDQSGMGPVLKRRLGALGARTEFPGHVTGERKRALLSRASVFVLPSHSEGLPVAVLEAMAARIPVVITRRCNLNEVEGVGAGVVCDDNGPSLLAALEGVIRSSDDARRRMGDAGRQLVLNKFTGQRSADALVSVCRWVVGRGARPDCVSPPRSAIAFSGNASDLSEGSSPQHDPVDE